MEGMVSLLDDRREGMVEALWAELARTFGLHGVFATPYPHFSYQIAERYPVAALEPIARRVAATTAPFVVETTGLGIFTGERPVLYIPVTRSLALSQFQAALWHELADVGAGRSDYYHPDHWMPHITIVFGDASPAILGAVVGYLSGRDLAWRIPVNNLAFIQEHDGRQQVRFRHDLTGPAATTTG